MDGIIMFSDILTPLPVLGIDFDVVKGTGPIIPSSSVEVAMEQLLFWRSLEIMTLTKSYPLSDLF